ncbi:hypothetical protein FUAX_10530 [Fulvitalea axinellae]|uniref:F5/8 type C domain-containing protein n=1 Tax=Fulvitalea axinellae TaxID=1182444 RepID=A0AAU9D6Z2_9BACT|nr:hypothetical protein FUAX_10530 [Fulvitalea axinellae]
MNIRKLSALICSLSLLIFGCGEENSYDPISNDGKAPASVTLVETVALPGAAEIRFGTPSDPDLLYVKAVYSHDGGKTQNEVKASLYDRKLLIQGFGEVKEYKIKLYAVDRGENESKPLEVSVTPLEAPVYRVAKSVKMIEDFGGVRYTWDNEDQAPVIVSIFAQDTLGRMENVETIYTDDAEGMYNIRGYDPDPIRVAVLVRDRWDNFSDTIKVEGETLTPLFEEQFDRKLYKPLNLDNDPDWNAWEGNEKNSFDGDINTFNHTWAGSGWPATITMDLGQTVKLSRFRLWQRQNFPYYHGNLKRYEIFGRLDEPPMDGSWDGWIKLRDCESRKPSGLPGTQETNEDVAHRKAGDEFSIPLEASNVRYIRLKITETWGGTTFCHFSEIAFYGRKVE